MKILFIGGTGNISASVSRLLLKRGHELHLLTRGTRGASIPGARMLKADIANLPEITGLVGNATWDAVVNWIAFVSPDVERDISLFKGRTRQYVQGFAGLLGNDRTVGHGFHITSDEVLSWNKIYAAVAEAVGSEARILHIPSDFIAAREPSLAGNLLGDKAHSVIFVCSGLPGEHPLPGRHPAHPRLVRGLSRKDEDFRRDRPPARPADRGLRALVETPRATPPPVPGPPR